MNIQFSFQKLEKNLEPFKKEPIETGIDNSGLNNVIRYVWNHYKTRYIDFDSFTYEDVMEAHEYMSVIDDDDTDVDDEFMPRNFENNTPSEIETNAFEEYKYVEDLCAALHHTQNKVYECEDDFI